MSKEINNLRLWVEGYQVMDRISYNDAFDKFGFWLDPSSYKIINGCKAYKVILKDTSVPGGAREGGYACGYHHPIKDHYDMAIADSNLNEYDDLTWQSLGQEVSAAPRVAKQGAQKVGKAAKAVGTKTGSIAKSLGKKISKPFSPEERIKRLQKKRDRIQTKYKSMPSKFQTKYKKRGTKVGKRVSNIQSKINRIKNKNTSKNLS